MGRTDILMMNTETEGPLLRHFRFFYKLFIAFFLTGVIPVALLSSSFALFSGGIVTGSYKQQGLIAIKGMSEDLNTLLERYRHTVYSLSSDDEIIAAILKDADPERSELLALYQKIYRALSGHIDHASLHVISRTGFPSFSTQQIPKSYLNMDDEAAGGLFALARKHPEKSWAVSNHFINERGNIVMMSLCRAVRDFDGTIIAYVVLDINKPYIAQISEEKNQDVFSQILIVNTSQNLVSDLRHSENDGNFSRLPFLSDIPDKLSGSFTKEDLLIIYTPLAVEPFVLVGALPLNIVLSNLSYLIRATLWLLLLCIILAVLLALLVSRSISRPVHSLTLAMGQVEEGDLSVRVSENREDEIGLLLKRFNIMTGQIETLVKETREEQEKLRVAERKALQAQINPHFLYNTLNTIKSIAKLEGIDQITTIVTQMGKLLRHTIDNEKEIVTLAESLVLVESYLSIQKIRFGTRLSYSIRIPEEYSDQPIPKLMLQPLVENAVIHGLEQKMGPGIITLRGWNQEKDLILEVQDNGKGIPPGQEQIGSSNSHGVGLSNVHRRLQLLYGAPYGLTIESQADKGTTIRIRVPLKEEE
ncbi:sensor histidine kinase [Oceanispirochaeta crateris]|uniref:histidine kinase n=1 Tax=Oceanispirochaeta crateris TaxID=2518645 RepID=A0A5C1QL65_9SPIO|nr:sensor histidine kinase [Oceanispirochaeta crateris]QEN08078.1 sensor histidine kinase [Oceanispirochaeta crateris]